MSDETKKDIPGVLAPPPLIHATGLTIAAGINFFIHPLPLTDAPWGLFAGGFLVGIGGGLMLASFWLFKLAKTDVRPWKPTTAVINRGLYRFSRNPIYLGMAVAHAGTAFLLNSWWILVFLVPVQALIHYGVIKREEAYLEAKFGDEYRAYKTTVRRWV